MTHLGSGANRNLFSGRAVLSRHRLDFSIGFVRHLTSRNTRSRAESHCWPMLTGTAVNMTGEQEWVI